MTAQQIIDKFRVISSQYNTKSKVRNSQDLNIRRALVELYLSVKVRTNESIENIDLDKLTEEQNYLEDPGKVNLATLLQYIKTSVQILINMKEDDCKETIHAKNKEGKICCNCKKKIKQSKEDIVIDIQKVKNVSARRSNGVNRFIRSQSFSSSNTVPSVASVYENQLRHYEEEIRGHI